MDGSGLDLVDCLGCMRGFWVDGWWMVNVIGLGVSLGCRAASSGWRFAGAQAGSLAMHSPARPLIEKRNTWPGGVGGVLGERFMQREVMECVVG